MTMMSTETILSAAPTLSEADLARAQQELRDGHLLVVPTDTVYGIGADAANPEAVAAVLAAKGRGRQMPPPVLVASVDVIGSLCVDVPDAARTLARAFWPGGLTLILRARPDLGWDLGETGGTIGVRMPNQDALLRLLRDFGPMAVTSANLTGQPPATSVQQAVGYFGGRVAAYLDGGPTQGSTASSIVDFAHDTPRVLRLGTIALDDLSAAAGVAIAPVQGSAS
ncbi:L-threonylcarbamoyladenylate synthase [Pauljensenia sp. 20925_1_27]